MEPVNFILFCLCTIGMSHIIVDGSILEWLRNFVKNITKLLKVPHLGSIVDCYMCSGTWCGFLMGYIWLTKDPAQIFACGCAGGFLSNIAASILNLIEASTIVQMGNHDGN